MRERTLLMLKLIESNEFVSDSFFFLQSLDIIKKTREF